MAISSVGGTGGQPKGLYNHVSGKYDSKDSGVKKTTAPQQTTAASAQKSTTDTKPKGLYNHVSGKYDSKVDVKA
jgi:hypothetical protein